MIQDKDYRSDWASHSWVCTNGIGTLWGRWMEETRLNGENGSSGDKVSIDRKDSASVPYRKESDSLFCDTLKLFVYQLLRYESE